MSDPVDLKTRLADAETQFDLDVAPADDSKARLSNLMNAIIDKLWHDQRGTEKVTFERDTYRNLVSFLVEKYDGGNIEELAEAMQKAGDYMRQIDEADDPDTVVPDILGPDTLDPDTDSGTDPDVEDI